MTKHRFDTPRVMLWGSFFLAALRFWQNPLEGCDDDRQHDKQTDHWPHGHDQPTQDPLKDHREIMTRATKTTARVIKPRLGFSKHQTAPVRNLCSICTPCGEINSIRRSADRVAFGA